MNDFDSKRTEILGTLQREAAAAASRRRAGKRAAAGTVAAALLVVATLQFTANSPTPTMPMPEQLAEIDPRITTHRADLAAYTITDDELVAALEQTGEAFTLMWIDGEPKLIEAPTPDSI